MPGPVADVTEPQLRSRGVIIILIINFTRTAFEDAQTSWEPVWITPLLIILSRHAAVHANDSCYEG